MEKETKQLDRMLELMGYKAINENGGDKINNSVQYTTTGADGKTYGIVREGTKFYIKAANTENEPLDYIGGFCNRRVNEHKSYALASKQLEFKLMSLNEANNKFTDVKVLDLNKKEDLALELTESMRKEIARERQLMESVVSITADNVGVPEAPDTQEFEISIGAPYEEDADAKLDTDLKATEDKPENAGDPFEETVKPDVDGDAEPKSCDKECDCGLEDAEYVPDNAIANEKGEDKEKKADGVKIEEDVDFGNEDDSDMKDEEDDKEKYISGLVESIIKDFGKHPGYQKKPMKISGGDGKAFGTSIGDSDPYTEVAKLLTDAIMDKLTKSDLLKKKSK